MRGFLAPAGVPVSLGTLIGGLIDAGNADRALARFRSLLCKATGTDDCWMYSSGRTALSVALRAMQKAGDPKKAEVIIPAYTCYTVAAAVTRAGLRVRLGDVDPQTLTLDMKSLERIDYSRVVAIVATSLYGFPDKLPELEQFARERGVFLVDDASQALGATVDGRPVAGFGDAGILSFGKGKVITTMHGGAIVARSGRLRELLEAQYAAAIPAAPRAAVMALAQLPAYALMLRPLGYSIVRQLPGLELGVTTYDPNFEIERYPAMLGGFGARLALKLDAINSVRQRNAKALQDALGGTAGIHVIRNRANSQAVALRQPVLVDSPFERQVVLSELERRGIGASPSYPQALCDVPEISTLLPQQDFDVPGARRIAQSIITLPTHAYCPRELPELVLEAIISTAPATTERRKAAV